MTHATNPDEAMPEWAQRTTDAMRPRRFYLPEPCWLQLRADMLRAIVDARRAGAIDAMLGLEHDALTDMEGADGLEFERAEYVAGVARKRALLISAARTEERWAEPATAIRERPIATATKPDELPPMTPHPPTPDELERIEGLLEKLPERSPGLIMPIPPELAIAAVDALPALLAECRAAARMRGRVAELEGALRPFCRLSLFPPNAVHIRRARGVLEKGKPTSAPATPEGTPPPAQRR